MKKFDKLIAKLQEAPLQKSTFDLIVSQISFETDIEIDLEMLQFYGLPINEENDLVYLKTQKNLYKDEIYCIVDIETNGNNPVKSQIIEIGAVKYHQGKIIDTFESFVHAEFIPDAIVRLTNITVEDLKDAPSLKKVLHDFKLFIKDTVFVAHNVNFDYNFISQSLKVIGLDELLNRKLCTVDLAKKTIQAQRHGLGFLKEHLSIDAGIHHRAYSDALSATKVLEESFKNVPEEIFTTEDLIKFSKFTMKKKKKKQKGNL